MKAEELRIGNWVYYMNEHNPVEISGIDRKQINADGDWDYVSEHKPIPLTEEWLTRFGFESKSKHLGLYKDGIWFVCESNLRSDSYQFGEWMQGTYCEIQYVHQLQNLYHALTGEELTITKQ